MGKIRFFTKLEYLNVTMQKICICGCIPIIFIYHRSTIKKEVSEELIFSF